MAKSHAGETAFASIRAAKSLSQLALISVILTTLTACTGVTEPRRALPVEGESAVLAPRVVETPVEVADTVIRCEPRWRPGAVCWQVTDSVTVR